MDDKDIEVYKEWYRKCGRLQGKVDIANLCLTVLGDREPVLCQKQLINILKKDKTWASKCEGVKMRG